MKCIIILFFTYRYAIIAYGAAGALVFMVYIVYDTQLMIGGKHKYSLDPEEYVFAALNLYLDIINLFLYLLSMIGASKNWLIFVTFYFVFLTWIDRLWAISYIIWCMRSIAKQIYAHTQNRILIDYRMFHRNDQKLEIAK